MQQIGLVEGLFAGKPQPFGSRGSASSIIKKPHSRLNIKFEGIKSL